MTKTSVHERFSTKTSSCFSGSKIPVFTNSSGTNCEAAVVVAAAASQREGKALPRKGLISTIALKHKPSVAGSREDMTQFTAAVSCTSDDSDKA